MVSVAKHIFKTHLFVFILVDDFSGSIKTEKSQNLFTLAENNFIERKLSCTCLNFGEILFAGTKPAALSGQFRSILPAHGACHIIRKLILSNISFCNELQPQGEIKLE